MATAAKSNSKETTVDDLAEQMAILRDDMGALTSTLADLMETKKAEVADAARAQVEEVKAAAKDKADDAVAQAASAQKYVDDIIARNPGTSLAAAAGVGFLIGMLSSRK